MPYCEPSKEVLYNMMPILLAQFNDQTASPLKRIKKQLNHLNLFIKVDLY